MAGKVMIMRCTGPIKSFSELMQLQTFEDRFNYLKLDGVVGEETFGTYSRRWMNQNFYRSTEWKRIKDKIIIRDNACDMGLQDYPLYNNKIYIHHMNPITEEDILYRTPYLTDPEYLICVSFETHNAIHYGDISVSRLGKDPAIRYPGDQVFWRLPS